MKCAVALQPRTDGLVMIRPLAIGDSAELVAGRDEEWYRWLGPGRDDPAPAACIVVADEVVGWIDYDGDLVWLETGEVNIGYNVFAAHRCNGYASRALYLLIRYLDECTAVQTATLLIDPRNAPSLAVAARIGFVPDGTVGHGRYFKRPVR
jgi:RimJ/RimL family protein N-acetyltransferase